MKDTELRVLDLGWGLEEGLEEYAPVVDGADFHNSPRLYDYDAVLIDPKGLNKLWEDHLRPGADGTYSTSPETDRGLSRGLENLLGTRRREVDSLLNGESGIILVRLRKPASKLEIVDGDRSKQVHRYSWLPGEWARGLFSENNVNRHSGNKFVLETGNKPAEYYLDRNREYVNCEATVQLRGPADERDEIIPVARTVTGELIAFELVIGEGRIIFLPPLDGIVPEEESERIYDLIESSLSPPHRTQSPEWAEKGSYRFEGEDEVREKVAKLDEEILSLEERKRKLEEEVKDYQLFRSLLYAGSRFELGNLLSEVLDRVGFKVQEVNSAIDVYACREGDDCFAIALDSSRDGKIGLDPYHRLVRGIDEFRIFENEDPQGVLLVNGYADREPENRGQQFTEELEQGCNLYGFTLITAAELFRRIKAGEEGDSSIKGTIAELFIEN